MLEEKLFHLVLSEQMKTKSVRQNEMRLVQMDRIFNYFKIINLLYVQTKYILF